MAQKTPFDLLEDIYNQAMLSVGSNDFITSKLKAPDSTLLDSCLEYSEKAKGGLTVIFTSLVFKALHPLQDIRSHQTSLPGGYSGRTFDTKHITPFIKSKKFPAMSDTGWLKKHVEQNPNLKFTIRLEANNLKECLDQQYAPILRPLSDMTEDEYDEIYAMQSEDILEVKKPEFEFDIRRDTAETTRYLLSRHFDLFDLIDAGLAIDKTKLNFKKHFVREDGNIE